MRPEDPYTRRSATPLIPQRSLLQASDTPDRDATAHHTAAANIARTQLDAIYGGHTDTPTPQTTPVAPIPTKAPDQQPLEADNPYQRTQHNPAEVPADQWKHYHSAWQDYYQKYYERYYVGQVQRAHQTLEARAAEAHRPLATEPQAASTATPPSLSRDEALHDLRSKIVGTIRTSATKVRKSRHFIPITAALCVVLLFLFLQYNRVLFANVQAYISPGDINPANIIIDPSTNVAVSPESKLIIPKINVDVPVDYNTKPDYDSQMKAMENGVAWFGIPGANSVPGQIGNTVISGHSSNDIIDQGSYKFIFARLDQLEKGDTIFINYQSKRYVYSITKKEVVAPTEVNKLIYPTDKPILTLITCTPLGTSLNRLLVTAEQVSPALQDATPPPDTSTTSEPAAIPGNSPTFLQRLFGGGEDE
jgi:sortase A